jgi:hypothetical protein
VTVDPTRAKGCYDGLAAVGGTSVGLFKISVTSQGFFTGKLTLAGSGQPQVGRFGSYGEYVGTAKSGATLLNTNLLLNSSLQTVSGTISIAQAIGTESYTIRGSHSMPGHFPPAWQAITRLYCRHQAEAIRPCRRR